MSNNKHIYKYWLSLTILLFSQQLISSEENKEIETYLGNFIKEYNIAGLQVAVFDADKSIFQKNFGYANPNKRISLQSNTIVFSASLSKLITTELVTLLAAQKKLGLNQKIVDFIPELKTLSPQFEAVTVQHLLTHTSGLNDDSVNFPKFKNKFKRKIQDNVPTLLEYIKTAKEVEFAHTTGETWAYADINFDLLGAIIEKVMKKPFAEVVEKMVFEPLNMRYSDYDRDKLSGFIFTQSYKKRSKLPGKSEKRIENQPHKLGSQGLFSAIYDLILWSQHQFKHSNKYIAWQPTKNVNETVQMGLGWHIKKHKGHKVVFHYGGYRGFQHVLALFPDLNKGIILLSNDANMEDHRDFVFTELANKFITP